jgi:hypothetical protein
MSGHFLGSVSSESGLEPGSPNHRTVSAPLGIYTCMALPIHRACRGSQHTNRPADGFFEDSLGRAVVNAGLAIESFPSQSVQTASRYCDPGAANRGLSPPSRVAWFSTDGATTMRSRRLTSDSLKGRCACSIPRGTSGRSSGQTATTASCSRRSSVASREAAASFSGAIPTGLSIRVRYIWLELTPTSARWEQVFSTDARQSWEANWVMRFVRA